MATFLPNVTDVFAGSSDFDPDFNRIERMLRLRSNMHQQGVKKVQSLYDSVFNSQMLRDQNVKTRDSYLKIIGDSLNTLSASDMSLQQNQETATNLFTPILTDQNISKDIAYTRNFYDQMSKAEKLNTSSDADTRKQYWSTGIKAMQYQAEEFKKADASSALGMASPTYIPKIDIQGIAEKLYEKSGISVKEDEINGGYIFTKKNGLAVFPITKSYVETMFANDPGISDMLKVESYVKRKDFMKQNATQYGGEDKAEQAYVQTIIKNGIAVSQDDLTVSTTEVKKLEDRVESWNKVIKTRGIIPDEDNKEYQQYLQDIENLEMAKQGLKSKKNQLTGINSANFDNIDEARIMADNLITYSLYAKRTEQIAYQLAFKGAEYTVKADPISLAQMHANLSLRNSMTMAGINFNNRLAVIDYQLERGIGGGRGKKGGTGQGGTVTVIPPPPRSSVTGGNTVPVPIQPPQNNTTPATGGNNNIPPPLNLNFDNSGGNLPVDRGGITNSQNNSISGAGQAL